METKIILRIGNSANIFFIVTLLINLCGTLTIQDIFLLC